MSKTYLVHAWCVRPFIAYRDEVTAETPQEAIAIARRQPAKLLDSAEDCSGEYPWDEFAAYGEDGTELLRILDRDARLRNAAPSMHETLDYVALMLADFKPDFLRQLGLDVALEQVEAALRLVNQPQTIEGA